MIVLDDIDANGMRLLPNPPVTSDAPNPTPGTPGTARYLDVNGDGGVSLLDAQQVADFLNAPALLMAALTPAVADRPTAPEIPGAMPAGQQERETQATASPLRVCQVEAVRAAAIDHFADAGVDSELIAAMAEVTVAVADLPAGQLGAATGSQITIDINGDGHGWLIDPTVYADDQFVSGGQCRVVSAESNSQQQYDLLTVVAHELAHTVGLSDVTGVDQQHDLMFHELSLGERRMPDAAAVDHIFGLKFG
jgi:predicted Zn-dependent protease with MMP-like domain